jgi:hypothetical protein
LGVLGREQRAAGLDANGLAWLASAGLLGCCIRYLADESTDLRTMQDYLGHRHPKHTYYTRVAGRRFEGLWRWQPMTRA